MLARLFFIGLFFFIHHAYATTSGPGVSFTYPLITLEPEKLRGYRASIWYQPPNFIWGRYKLYLDTSIGHWWVPHLDQYQSVSILAVAPVFRFMFAENNYFSPFFEASIGFSYLSNTRLETYNLGMHFAFQDQLTVGALIGKEQRFSASLGGMHYSNGSLCEYNRGMTMPLILMLGYRF